MEITKSTTFLFIAFLTFILLSLKWTKKSRTRLPPGPPKLPFFGNLHQLLGSTLPHHTFTNLAKKYGPFMHLQLGEIPTLVISSPEAAKQIIKSHGICFANRPQFFATKILSYNSQDLVFAPYGEFWRQMRKICILELLSAKRVQSFKSIREEEVQNLIESISSASRSQMPLNISKMIFALSNHITSRAAFGNKWKRQDEFIGIMQEMVKIASGFDLLDIFPSKRFVLQWFPGIKGKLEAIFEKTNKMLDEIIDEHREARKDGIGDHHQENLLDVLLRLESSSDDPEFPVTIDIVKAMILDIFGAGTETSSTTTAWALSELIKSPQVMKQAQAEVRRVLTGKSVVDEKDLEQLKYLKLVIKETLRLHPPAALIPRESIETCEVNGYEIPAKTRVIMNAWAIGRDPKYWPNPECFTPERFRDSPVDFQGTHFEYIPFGGGRRICPGITFGLSSVELSLARLLFHFDWKFPDGINPEDLDMTEGFGATTKRKNDLHAITIPYVSSI